MQREQLLMLQELLQVRQDKTRMQREYPKMPQQEKRMFREQLNLHPDSF